MPYDVQTCKLSFMLPNTPDWLIQLWWNQLSGQPLTNPEWTIDQVKDWKKSVGREVVQSVFGAANISSLKAEFKLRRRPSYMLENYVFQGFIFYSLSWVGLWVDAAAVPARAALGIIPVLVTSNRMSALSTTIPPISYSTRLETFMTMTLVMISLHVVEFGAIHFANRWYKKLSEEKQKREQAWQGSDEDGTSRLEPSRSRGIAFNIVVALHNHLDVHSRWLSPLIYAVGTGALLG